MLFADTLLRPIKLEQKNRTEHSTTAVRHDKEMLMAKPSFL